MSETERVQLPFNLIVSGTVEGAIGGGNNDKGMLFTALGTNRKADCERKEGWFGLNQTHPSRFSSVLG